MGREPKAKIVTKQDMQQGFVATGILFTFVLADVALRLSVPGAIPLSGLIAFLAFLVALALVLIRTVDWSVDGLPSRLPAALAIALYALHPTTVSALGDWGLVASLTGIAAGLVIFQWNPDRAWHRWVSLLPAIACILLHRAGIGFAFLLAASAWLYGRDLVRLWPAAAVSILAGIVHRGEPYAFATAIAAVPATIANFIVPFVPSLGTDWSVIDGLVSTAVVLAAIAAAAMFGLRTISFGLSWFLLMLFLAPGEPVAALPGLAIAVISGLLAFLPLPYGLKAAAE